MAWDGVQGMLLEASTQVEGINDVDIDDVYSARQLLMKRSVMSDVKAKLLEAAENQWEDWLEFSLFQAESLGLDYHEDVSDSSPYPTGNAKKTTLFCASNHVHLPVLCFFCAYALSSLYRKNCIIVLL